MCYVSIILYSNTEQCHTGHGLALFVCPLNLKNSQIIKGVCCIENAKPLLPLKVKDNGSYPYSVQENQFLRMSNARTKKHITFFALIKKKKNHFICYSVGKNYLLCGTQRKFSSKVFSFTLNTSFQKVKYIFFCF